MKAGACPPCLCTCHPCPSCMLHSSSAGPHGAASQLHNLSPLAAPFLPQVVLANSGRSLSVYEASKLASGGSGTKPLYSAELKEGLVTAVYPGVCGAHRLVG